MSRNAAHHAGVLILYFSLNDAVAEGLVVRGGWNRSSPRGWRVEGGVHHCQRPEDLVPAEMIERFFGDALQGNAENDESDVAICRFASGIGGERGREGCGK